MSTPKGSKVGVAQSQALWSLVRQMERLVEVEQASAVVRVAVSLASMRQNDSPQCHLPEAVELVIAAQDLAGNYRCKKFQDEQKQANESLVEDLGEVGVKLSDLWDPSSKKGSMFRYSIVDRHGREIEREWKKYRGQKDEELKNLLKDYWEARRDMVTSTIEKRKGDGVPGPEKRNRLIRKIFILGLANGAFAGRLKACETKIQFDELCDDLKSAYSKKCEEKFKEYWRLLNLGRFPIRELEELHRFRDSKRLKSIKNLKRRKKNKKTS